MLSLDEYINAKNKQKLQDFLKNQKEFESSLNFNSIDLSNLTPEQKIIQVKLTYKLSDYLFIKDKIDWDLVVRKKSIESYIDLFLKKLAPFFEKPELVEENRKSLRKQFFEQILEQLIKLNKFPTFHVIENKSELNGINELCPKCHTVKINRDLCINCFYKFEGEKNYTYNLSNKEEIKKKININNNKIPEEGNKINLLNERQRILSLRQKSINIEEGSADEKLCKKCGEINDKINLYCIKCGEKFPVATCLDSTNINSNYSINNDDESSMINNQINNNYCVHFFEKINKNHIISQLKDFGNYFNSEDFSSLKFLYSRTKEIVSKHYQDIITAEAYEDLMNYLDSMYSLYSKPSPSSFKIFNKAYENRYHKERPLTNELNFNDLSDDIKTGWLPENDVNTKYIKQNVNNKNVKIYDNIVRNNNASEDDDEIIETMMIAGGGQNNAKKIEENEAENLLTRRKRGRPKKIEIFKDEAKYLNKENNNIEIIPSQRKSLLMSDIIMENELLHFDFCGECGGYGKLICCETCPTAYHYECVGYDRFPRGKYKCYFCKVAKLGISQAVTVTQKHIYLLHTLFERDKNYDFWFIVARSLINVLKVHQCSSFFKDPVPEELEDYFKVVKEPRDLSLVEIKLNNWEYKTLHKFLDDLEYVWKDIKLFFKPNSFFWKCADVLEIFVRHLIKDEKIFERFESIKYEEITQEQIEMFNKYWMELKIRKKNKEENKMNNKIKIKKSHKKKEKYVTIINETDNEEKDEKKDPEKNININESNFDLEDDDIIIESDSFPKEKDKSKNSNDIENIKKKNSEKNKEEDDIIITSSYFKNDNNEGDNDDDQDKEKDRNNNKNKEDKNNNYNDEEEDDEIIITDDMPKEVEEKNDNDKNL